MLTVEFDLSREFGSSKWVNNLEVQARSNFDGVDINRYNRSFSYNEKKRRYL
jgi:hypothetical protein